MKTLLLNKLPNYRQRLAKAVGFSEEVSFK